MTLYCTYLRRYFWENLGDEYMATLWINFATSCESQNKKLKKYIMAEIEGGYINTFNKNIEHLILPAPGDTAASKTDNTSAPNGSLF